MEQVISDQVKSIKHLFANFNLAKEDWTYDSLLNSLPRMIKEYQYNEQGQLLIIDSYNPRQRMNVKFEKRSKYFPLLDSFHYEMGKLVFHRHKKENYFYQHAIDKLRLKKVDRNSLETLERYEKSEQEINAFILPPNEAEKPKALFRYQSDTLVYSMVWQPTHTTESNYIYNNQQQLSK